MYGSVQGVASLSSMWTNDGVFEDSYLYTVATKPSATEVETWLNEVSSSLDIALATEGFETPVTNVQIKPALDAYANSVVKDLVDYSHGAGRYFTDKTLGSGSSPMMIVDKETVDFVQRKVIGFTALGLGTIAGFVGKSTAGFSVLR